MSNEIMDEQAEMMQTFRREFPNALTLDDLMRQAIALKADRDRLAEKITLMEDTIGVLRAELKRVSEELARRYE